MPKGRNSRNRKTQRRRKSRMGGGNNNLANRNGLNIYNNPTPNFVASNIHRPEPNNLISFKQPPTVGLNGIFNPRKRYTRQNGQRNLRQGESNALWANAFASPPIGKRTWKNWLLRR